MVNIKQILVNNNTSIKNVMGSIDSSGLRTAMVVNKENKLCGIVTDGDIRRSIIRGVDISEKISKIMTDRPIYVKTNTKDKEIIKKIKKNKLLGVPIINENRNVVDYATLSKSNNINHLSHSPNLNKRIKRVLIIGGAGYIGSVLVEKLLGKSYKVKVLDKFIYGKSSLKKFKNNSNLKIIEGDTRHIEDITKAIKKVDAVVHLAELVGDPACALEPKKAQEINHLAMKTVASVCKYFQINKFIFASSCSVYGNSERENLLDENSKLNPVSLYAKMKIASEKVLKEMEDENFLPTVLRFATVFGFSHRPRFDLVVNLLTAKAVKERKITIYGGDQWRPNVHVSDVAKAIIKTLESPLDKVGGEIFNVGANKNNYTMNQIGKLIKKEIPNSKLIKQNKKTDKRSYKVDFSKLKNTLGIRMKDLRYGIKEIKNYLSIQTNLNYKSQKYSNIKYLKNNRFPS